MLCREPTPRARPCVPRARLAGRPRGAGPVIPPPVRCSRIPGRGRTVRPARPGAAAALRAVPPTPAKHMACDLAMAARYPGRCRADGRRYRGGGRTSAKSGWTRRKPPSLPVAALAAPPILRAACQSSGLRARRRPAAAARSPFHPLPPSAAGEGLARPLPETGRVRGVRIQAYPCPHRDMRYRGPAQAAKGLNARRGRREGRQRHSF